MDIDIFIDTINSTTEYEKDEKGETELEKAKNQILGLGIAKPQIQITTIDKIDLPKSSEPKGKAMARYKQALKEKREVEFNRRVKAQEFRRSIRSDAGNVKIDPTLSNKPNKKR